MRVVVLTGAGDKAFCAGADLSGIAENAGAAAAHDGRGLLADLFRDMWSLGKPIVARVRGYALAGGFGLACACDLVVAADDAVFGTPEINVGLWPYMITVPLLRSMPPKTVLELMMTGRRVSADEGARIGFVHRVVPVAELDATVDALAADARGEVAADHALGPRLVLPRARDGRRRRARRTSRGCSRSRRRPRTPPKASPRSPRSARRSGRAADGEADLVRRAETSTTGARSSATSRSGESARSRWAAPIASSASARSAS